MKNKPEVVYSKDERQFMLIQMKLVSRQFYTMATKIGNHPFIEICGLMNEYIKICETAHARDIDFTQCSVHTSQELPIAEHNLEYLNEKIGCIFSEQLELVKTKQPDPK